MLGENSSFVHSSAFQQCGVSLAVYIISVSHPLFQYIRVFVGGYSIIFHTSALIEFWLKNELFFIVKSAEKLSEYPAISAYENICGEVELFPPAFDVH